MAQNHASEQLCCPVCHRDYELPRRYLIKKGDFDFSPIPRLLPCLHDMCHSCLEEQFENDQSGNIKCILCKHTDKVKGVVYMPLNMTIMKQVVRSNSSELLAFCSRCYDAVPSISWCKTCSSALCEFHHQDHKLSVDTAKHSFLTFKEYLRQEKHIEFQFPPLYCPESTMQDCSLYCNTCQYLISTKSFVDFHKAHDVVNFVDVVKQKKTTVENAVLQSKSYVDDLHSRIAVIKKTLSILDDNEEDLLKELNQTFAPLYAQLKKREKTLKEQIQQYAEKKREMLVDQLTLLSELCEENEYVAQVGEQLLLNTNGSENESMYLISASETIDKESDRICDTTDAKIKSLLSINPMTRLDILSDDIMVIKATISKLGGVLENTTIEVQSEQQPEADSLSNEKLPPNLPSIQFSVATR
jgi:CII-binding regulator of phage lambda lysogenization HflD